MSSLSELISLYDRCDAHTHAYTHIFSSNVHTIRVFMSSWPVFHFDDLPKCPGRLHVSNGDIMSDMKCQLC